ncbi:hypothetical protein GF382_03845, partial [Candidatus Falkowbacteria bacterium]|nr:hypothetical protein [Candidatus Falkowbacteria bacterium]
MLVLRLFEIIFKIIAGVLVLAAKPVIFLFRFIFFKILVKIYLSYFSLARKLGWDKLKGSF